MCFNLLPLLPLDFLLEILDETACRRLGKLLPHLLPVLP
jgi:hypothetical protein